MITNRECDVHEIRMLPTIGMQPPRRRRLHRRGRAAARWLRMAFARARRRARLRFDLERLDTHMLRDIGARRIDLEAEAAKPFWRR